MDEFEKFNQCFPNSRYRLVWPQYSGDLSSEEGLSKYQGRKSPVNGSVYTYDEIREAMKQDKYSNCRVGWIVSDGYLVVDIDNKKSAGKVYNILTKKNIKYSYMLSLHGGHFIFKATDDAYQTAGDICALGVSVDTRAAGKGYIVLPVNDTDRAWGAITSDVDVIPFWLKPLKQFKKTGELLDLGANQGRNDALLKHFLALMDYGKGLNTEEKIESIRLINNFLFKEPLSEKELDSTVLRQSLIEEKEKQITASKSCLEERIANKILEKYNIINVGGVFYIYTGKYYREIKEIQEIERLIHFEYSENLKEHQRKEVIKFLELKSWVPAEKVNKEWNEIVFENGIYNISTDKLLPHDSKKYNTTFVPQTYYPNAEYSGAIDGFFTELCKEEPDKRTLLYEIIGYCLLRKNIFSKFFVCYGGGGTGKSTYLKLIEKLVGAQNTSYLSLQDLEERYLPAELFGKLVNIGDDISTKALKETPVLKKATTGEMLLTQRKFIQQPLCFTNYAKLIFACNAIPNIYDTTTGLYRRMVLISIDRPIENPDPFFLDKLTDMDMQYLLMQAIKAVRAALARGKLSDCLSSKLALEKYQREQSSVLTYIDEYGYTPERYDKRECAVMYEEYKNFCQQYGFMAYKKSKFDNEICLTFNMDKKKTTNFDGNVQWRYVIRCLKK